MVGGILNLGHCNDHNDHSADSVILQLDKLESHALAMEKTSLTGRLMKGNLCKNELIKLSQLPGPFQGMDLWKMLNDMLVTGLSRSRQDHRRSKKVTDEAG